MDTVLHLILVLGGATVAYGALAAGLTIRAILKKRDSDYRALYVDFLEQRRRVRRTTKGDRGDD